MIIYHEKALPINSARWGSPGLQQVENLKSIAMVRHFAWSQIFRPDASRPYIFGVITAASSLMLNYSRFCVFEKFLWWSDGF
jgi:hypothetical protein